MSTEYTFSEAEALRHVTAAANVEQLRAAVLAVIDAADCGGYVDEVRDLKHLLWTGLTTKADDVLDEDVAEPSADAPEVRAVVGTHHPAGPVRRPTGRRAVGFQLKES